MGVDIQGLEFEIEAKSNNASKGIDDLAESFKKLKASLKGGAGLTNVTKKLEAISNAKVSFSGVEKISDITKALTELSQVKISKTIATRITEIGAALDTISLSGVENIQDVSRALHDMDGITIPNLGAVNASGGSVAPTTVPTDSGVSDVSARVAEATGNFNALKFAAGEAMGVIGVSHYWKVATSSLSQLGAKIRETIGNLGSMYQKFKDTGGIIGWFGRRVKSVATFASKLAAKMKTLTSLLKRNQSATKGATGKFGQLFSSLKRIAMYRAIRAFFSALTAAMKEGIQNLYQYSEIVGGKFAGSMDTLATSFQYLKNSMGAMVAPLINAIAPAVDMLIDKFVSLLNIVNQFFARLSGATSFTRAKKQAASYGDSISGAAGKAKKAAKEIKDATTGIDELNIINQKDDSDSGSGSGGKDFAGMFEEVPIDSGISEFTDKLKEAFNSGNWKELGELLGNKFNELVEKVDWTGIGQKAGYYLNGAIQTSYHFLKTADFRKLGNHVSEMLNSALGEIDFKVAGRLLTRSFTSLLNLLIGALEKLDWGLVGKSLGDFLKGAFTEAQEWIASYDWSKMAHEVYTNLKKFLTGMDFAGIAKSFFKLLGSALGAAVSFIATFVKDVVKDIGDYFKKYITNEDGTYKDSGIDIVKGLLKGIWEGMKNIGKWIKENVFDPFIEGFKKCFGIHSPSKVMKEMGGYIVEGFLQGLNKFSEIAGKVKKFASDVIEWFTKGEDGKGIVEHFKDLGSKVVSGFKEKVGNTYQNVKSNVTTWASSVKDWFTNSSFGGVNYQNFSSFANNTIEGFKSKIGSAYTNTKSNITTWANNVKDWFTNSSFGGVNSTNFSTFANNTIEGFKTKIGSAYTNTKSNITTWASNVKDWFTNSSFGGVNNSNFQTFANNTIEGFKTKIGSAYTNTKSNITTWASNVKSWFTGAGFGGVNNSTFQTYANNIITGFKDKIGNAYTDSKSNITTWASNVKSWFSSVASKTAFSGFASDVITGFKEKIGTAYTDAKTNMTTFATKVKSWFTDKVSKSSFYDIASDVVEGFKNGIGALYTTCKNTITTWGSSIITWFKDKLDINSPSKVFYNMGGFAVAGFNNAITTVGKTTKNVVGKWSDSFTSLQPALAMSVDTSALRYYDSSAFAKSISTDVHSRTEVSAFGFKEALEDFYNEYVQPTMTQMADDMRRQADKSEHTVVQVGNRVVSDAVEIQQKANGYRFTK